MRIGIVTQAYYPIPGGVTEHVYYLAQHLQNLGHQPTIITSQFLRSNHFNHDDHLDVIRIGLNVPMPIPFNGSFNSANFGYQISRKLLRIYAEKKFDVVHIHSPLDPILPLLALRALPCPLVGTFHSYGKSALLFDFFRRSFATWINRLSGRIAVSQAAKEYIESYFPGEYAIIPNGIDTARFNPTVKTIEKFNDDYFNILFVGRMAPRKGLKNLLRAFPLVCARYPQTRLIVVGSGFLADYYKLFYPSTVADRVDFVGYVSRDRLAQYYASADVYCSPATGGESFGIVLLEAMASGTPIVASAIRGYRDVVTNEQEGLLVPPEDPLVLRDAIVRLIEDKQLRARLGTAGQKKAKEYSWGAVAKQVADYYEEVLKKKTV